MLGVRRESSQTGLHADRYSLTHLRPLSVIKHT